MIELDFHNNKYEHELQKLPTDIFTYRVNVFPHFENLIGTKITGNVLDLGCGNGYAGIWMAQNRKVSNVTCLDASKIAIKKLVPRNAKYFKVEETITPVLGDFSNIGDTPIYDFIVAFGSLHHSPCLYTTLNSISKSLKPDGYLIAHEPCMPNTTKHNTYIKKYNDIEKRFGLVFRHGDRYDRFHREAEYICAGIMNGFDLIASEIFPPNQSVDINPTSKIFYFQKKVLHYIPHIWKPLKNYFS